MYEGILLVAALAGISKRAHQRGLDKARYFVAAVAGFVLLALLASSPLGPTVSFLLLWGWLVGLYVVVETSHGSTIEPDVSWRCPDCTQFNDGTILVWPCGHEPDR